MNIGIVVFNKKLLGDLLKFPKSWEILEVRDNWDVYHNDEMLVKISGPEFPSVDQGMIIPRVLIIKRSSPEFLNEYWEVQK